MQIRFLSFFFLTLLFVAGVLGAPAQDRSLHRLRPSKSHGLKPFVIHSTKPISKRGLISFIKKAVGDVVGVVKKVAKKVVGGVKKVVSKVVSTGEKALGISPSKTPVLAATIGTGAALVTGSAAVGLGEELLGGSSKETTSSTATAASFGTAGTANSAAGSSFFTSITPTFQTQIMNALSKTSVGRR